MPRLETDIPSTPLPPGTGLALAPEDVFEFRTIVREETGVDIPETEAWNRAIELIALVRMLLSPLPEDPHLPRGGSSDVTSLDGPA